MSAMAVALGEAGIKTLEDLAGCATDDLLGYYEQHKDKERTHVTGALGVTGATTLGALTVTGPATSTSTAWPSRSKCQL